MTPPPPAATAAPRASGLGRRGARIPRRSSGPSRPASAAPRIRAGALALPRGLELPRIAPRELAASAAFQLRALFGGRGLIVVLAGMLLGLVFLQVLLLKQNTQISQNVESAHELERGNAALRTTISRLDAGQRIQDAAGGLGLVMPGPGSVCYLDARRAGPCSGGDPAAVASAAEPLPAQTAAPAAATAPVAAGTPDSQATAPAQQPVAPPAPAQAQPAQPQTATPPSTPTAPATTQQPAAAPVQDAAPAPRTQASGGIVAGAAQ